MFVCLGGKTWREKGDEKDSKGESRACWNIVERIEKEKKEITDVLVLVSALIPLNVPGIKGGVHPFSLTLTIALREAQEPQSWQKWSGFVPAVHLHVWKKRMGLTACFIAPYFPLLPSHPFLGRFLFKWCSAITTIFNIHFFLLDEKAL